MYLPTHPQLIWIEFLLYTRCFIATGNFLWQLLSVSCRKPLFIITQCTTVCTLTYISLALGIVLQPDHVCRPSWHLRIMQHFFYCYPGYTASQSLALYKISCNNSLRLVGEKEREKGKRINVTFQPSINRLDHLVWQGGKILLPLKVAYENSG